MHLMFLCPFSKAAWYCHPWYIKTEILAATHHNIPNMIQALLSSRAIPRLIKQAYTHSCGVYGKQEMIASLIENVLVLPRFLLFQMLSCRV